jgi:tetratricopeptide (TPR) repeat protein
MPDKIPFHMPIPPEPKGKRVSAAEAEKILLEKLAYHEKQLEQTIFNLACLNSQIGHPEIATQYLNRLMANTDDPEKKASYLLAMGCLMEKTQDYETAIVFYSQALSLEPTNRATWYFINNNLGYCLNYFNKYVEAESYCRAAIKIEPRKHNAYKNLGISMEGQGKYPEAAVLYIKAVETNPRDPRAFKLLEELVAKHEAIKYDIPDIQAQINKCREAVRSAHRRLPGNKDN